MLEFKSITIGTITPFIFSHTYVAYNENLTNEDNNHDWSLKQPTKHLTI